MDEQWMDGWTVDGRTDRSEDGRRDGRMVDGGWWTDRTVDAWMDGRVKSGQVDRWMDGG